MKIRVLHVIDHLGFGGAPMVVKNIAENVDSRIIETFVCALRTNPRPLPVKATLINLGYGKYNPFVAPAIVRICKEYRIDIVHAHLPKSIISSLIAGYFCSAKIVIHKHGAIFSPGTGCVFRLLLRALRRRAVLAIANSQVTRKTLHQTTGFALNSIRVIGNFVDFGRFDRRCYDRGKVRATLGIGEDETVIGFVGRLDPAKGADLLIEAAKIISEHGLKYRIVIAGDGPQRRWLERLALQSAVEDRVIFTGLCQNPAEVMMAFDIGVVPSRQEAFGMAAIEMMRMGVPVIASPVGGLVEIIQHEQTGLLLDSLRPQSIAGAITRLVQDQSLRKKVVDNAEVFSRRFDGKEQLQQIIDIYRQLCPEKSSGNPPQC